MRRLGATSVGLLVAALLPAAPSAQRTDEVLQFSMPSKNIGCAYAVFSATPNSSAFPANLRCDIRSRLHPKPAKPRGCDLDWGDSFEMSKRGRVLVTCHGDTALGSKHILAYGRTWRHDGFSCTSRMVGLTCKNLAGHGFFLSRRRWRVF